MDFELDEELKMIQGLVRDFVSEQLRPLERDLMGRAGDLSDACISLPVEQEDRLVRMVQEMGMWGASVPEELGGVGLSTLGTCLVEEELAQTVIPFGLGDVTPILYDCNDRQMENYFLPALYRQKKPYLALMEPEKGGEIAGMAMRAERENSSYILDGQKLSFTQASGEYFAVVFAVTEGTRGREGVSCFLVDKDAPGFSVAGGEEKAGWQAQLAEPLFLSFDQCRVPVKNILGEVNGAFHLGEKWLPARRVVRGARCVGVAQRLLEEATIQAESWQSFGQPVYGRMDIQASLSAIAMDIHAGRLMVYEAAWRADRGESIRNKTAMVKLFTTQMVYRVIDEVTHIYGGPAYVAGLPMKRLCRHALAASAAEFALDVQRNIIARELLKGLKV
ncbi:MAG: acyl-CoA dehydrogenase family protein [Dehalococcoidales bacterium]|nr:MAG: acyl-CoA dehydrogenase family protein [Dehalococcoidales bacterium]